MFYYISGSGLLSFSDGKSTWHQAYDQGSTWRNVSITIHKSRLGYIRAVYYSTRKSVIAIDDISVTERACAYPTSKWAYNANIS